MAKGQTVAIWIILVVVLAAAAGVIAIAVQNSKREQQLNTVQGASTLVSDYLSKTPGGGTATVSRPGMKPQGRPSMRANKGTHSSAPSSSNKPAQVHGAAPAQGRGPAPAPGRGPIKGGAPVAVGRPVNSGGDRYDTAMVNAQASLANRLPSQYPQNTYNSNVSMTTFAPPPGPAHVMSTQPPQYRSGGGALFVPNQSPQADMPAQQLFVSHSFPSTMDTNLQDLANFSTVNSYVEHGGAVGTTMSDFVGSAYFQDPATMTPNTYADGLGLDAYMPDVSNATPEGLDPQTGLPVFSTASLKRSNALSSRGLNGYLRPTMDDTQGYKKTIGKRLQPCRYNDCELDKRRNQFNAARLNSGGEDPVLFNQTDFMYLR